MKALLGTLLLVNVALLLWNMGQREFVNDKHAPAAEFHPELMELLPPEQSRSLAKVTVEATGEVISSNDEQAALQSGQVVPGPIDDAGTGTAVAETSLDKASHSSTEAGDESTDVIAGQCMMIGPYLTILDRDRAGRQLQDMKVNFSESKDPQGRLLGYRVYQGPFSTEVEVSRAKRRLEKQGVKDLYLMNEGHNRRYISLGFFSNKRSASEFMKNFTVQGIESKQRLEYTTYYWLIVSDIDAIKKLTGIDAMPIPPGISKTIKTCPGSATE